MRTLRRACLHACLAAAAICITPGAHQYMYVSNSNDAESLDNGEIYKMELDGTVLGKFGKPGHAFKEFSSVHQMDCRNPDEVYVSEITAWRAQKLILRPQPSRATAGRQ